MNFLVDTVAPDTTLSGGPDGLTPSNEASFTFTSPDPAATFECRFDEVEDGWEPCVSPWEQSGLADGAHTFEVRAVDAAGNVDEDPPFRQFTVDTTPPDTAIDSGPSGPTADSTPTFAVSTPDPEATFECRIDAAPFAACPASFTPAQALPDGTHTFEARAVDPVGNPDPTPASRSFTVDTTAPDTTITGGPAGLTPDPAPDFEFSAGEAGVTYECRFDAR